MALVKLTDFDPDYRNTVDDKDIKGFGVYTQGDEKVGTVDDLLVDEVTGQFRYFIVDLGFWIFGKKVLLPVGRSRVDHTSDRVYVVGLTKQQAEELPEFNNDMEIDYDHEERVRGVYRTSSTVPETGSYVGGTSDVGIAGSDAAMAGAAGGMYDTATPAEATTGTYGTTSSYDRDSYNYDLEPSLYGLNDTDHQSLKLYEERLIANKQRIKTGEVAVGKRVETETARASVPIEKERVVIERVEPGVTERVVSPGEANFQEGEVARMEIYEETPDIHKEAFVREEVRVKKEVERETVDAEETLRREELDIDSEGRSIEDKRI
jgi:uncharacterized protein (TIGR02271 family)